MVLGAETMSAKIRVLLADDHTLVRAGLRALLNDMQGVEVVAEASTGREAIELAEKHEPDVVLMDIAMSGLNGLEAAEHIIKSHSRSRVIILSMYSTKEYVTRALQIGVKGYLVKDAAASELEIALQAVALGKKYLSPAISTHLIDQYEELSASAGAPSEILTPRQREILQLIAEGRTTKEIAGILDVSLKTVDTHRTQLMERLGIHDVAGLVRYAVRTGLISPDK
jgi:DNA-binding NarL/FixJ family response regulator